MKATFLGVAIIIAMVSLTRPAPAQELVKASWYYLPGLKMADGELFNRYDATIAAHRTLPFGTILKITNPENQDIIFVIVQDRGPYIRGRQIDLSRAAAQKLGIIRRGVAPVLIEIIGTVG